MDDDGKSLTNTDTFASVEVSHIMPYSLTQGADGRIDEAKRAAITILDMSDLGVTHPIEGPSMGRPYNALTLSHEMHMSFEQCDIFFDRILDATSPRFSRAWSMGQYAKMGLRSLVTW